MTGPVDYVSDGKRTYSLSNGHELMGRVSGTGCMLSAVVGCYVGTKGASVDSVGAAISAFCIAGDLAGEKARGPGTFKPLLFDALYNMDGKVADERRRYRSCTASTYHRPRSLFRQVAGRGRASHTRGADVVQLRDKHADGAGFSNARRSWKRLTQRNVHRQRQIDIAMLSKADGVHLGQSDIPYECQELVSRTSDSSVKAR